MPDAGPRRQPLGLRGRVVIVSVTEPSATRALAAEAATVVVVGSDGEAVGTLVAEIEIEFEPVGAHAVAFVGDPASEGGAAALAEMVAELFPAVDG